MDGHFEAPVSIALLKYCALDEVRCVVVVPGMNTGLHFIIRCTDRVVFPPRIHPWLFYGGLSDEAGCTSVRTHNASCTAFEYPMVSASKRMLDTRNTTVEFVSRRRIVDRNFGEFSEPVDARYATLSL